MLEVAEDPKGLWTLFAGDATACYTTTRSGKTTIRSSMPSARCLLVRGKHPYVLVVDDFRKDDTAHNYRWVMNNCMGLGIPDGAYLDAAGHPTNASLAVDPGATSTQAVLYHENDAKLARRPSLLVRELGAERAGLKSQPAINVDSPRLCNGYDINTAKTEYAPSRRLVIDRDNVIEPNYIVLLYPHLTGDVLPVTEWSSDGTKLTITSTQDGTADTITLDRSNPDHRTRFDHVDRVARQTTEAAH